GGYATSERGTELEEATTPNLDRLAAEGSVGLVEPVGPGITPGSGPGHLGLFGYDPLEYELGRGALSAAGLDVELKPGDVAARGNLATLDAQVRRLLAGQPKANTVLLRGFDSHRELPSLQQRHGLTPAAVAIYPMYRGIARLVGMEVLPRPDDLDAQVAQLREQWDRFDYFFVHHKYTDSAGEDGDFDRKVAAIETLDAAVPAFCDLRPDVLIVTGDHAT